MAAVTGLPDASAWTLDPGLAHLNHGSFGATPACVLAEQHRLRAELERNPVGFLVHQLPGLLENVRAEIAAFLRADPAGVVFVDNATTGTQTVIAQADLAPGDEVLATDHGYPAVLAQLQRAADSAGATLTIAPVPLPAASPAAVTEAVLARLTPRTRLLVIDHIASCSGMVFPVADIVARCRAAGVPVLIDGAHAPGMLPLDLRSLDADYWTGNLHKWVSAPKASAVLYVAERHRDRLRPLVASHGLTDGYQAAFDWTGTRDPTALLSVPAALAFFGQAGWPNVWQHNNELSQLGAELVSAPLGTEPPAPGELTAAMRLVRLPEPLTAAGARALERRLLHEHRVVVPVTDHGGWRWLRLSAQLYNTRADYERLADVIGELVPGGRP
jgi:isopenicillin-N epimerase